MMMLKRTVALLSVAALGASAADIEATTGAVTASFMGSSGGMKLFPNEGDNWLMIQQSKLQEVDANGQKIGGGSSLAGQNDWTALTENTNDDGAVVYSTTFSKKTNDYDFSLTAHLAKTTTTTNEAVPCSNCTTSTEGDCQDATNACAASSNNTCAANFTQCTNAVSVVKDELKFSVFLSGWTFKDAANSIDYEIMLSWKGAKENTNATSEEKTDEMKTTIPGAGFVQMPTKATIIGGEEDKEIDITITESEQGGKTVYTLKFPSFGAGESIYYDPVLSVETGATSGATSTTFSMLSVATLAMATVLFA